MRRRSSQWTFATRDDDASDSGEEYVPSSQSSRHRRRRSSRRKSTSPSASSARSRRGSRRSLSLVSRRSSMSSSMTSSTSVASRFSRMPHGAAPAPATTDEDLSSEMDSTDEDAETKRLREPSFNMAPEMSGCLLQFAVDVSRKLREGGDTRNLLVSPLLLAGMLVMLLHGCASRTSASAAALGRALHVHWAPFRMARSYDRVAGATMAPFRRPKLRVRHFTYTCFMALFHDDSVPLARSYYQMQVPRHRRPHAKFHHRRQRSFLPWRDDFTSHGIGSVHPPGASTVASRSVPLVATSPSASGTLRAADTLGRVAIQCDGDRDQ
ncbi:uncharacterized protein [Dermacentor andersoni]|uniref:uncharacterized protein n=1 Tax=Dermacentor andersoni TaxID=34620 RepID=UPI002416EF3B|nr:uncharacterized protein LOC129385449 [Dermacentor andersoni]